MKTNQLAIATLAVLLGTAPILLHASDQPSKDWLEAKKVFAPVNALRQKIVGEDSKPESGTTVRVLDDNGKKDLTVFPAVDAGAEQSSLSVTKIDLAPEQSAQSGQLNSEETASQSFASFGQQIGSSAKAELVLLPAVEPLASSFQTGGQANSQVAYATQAYMAEEAVADAAQAEMTEGEYNQSQGAVEWSGPVTSYGCCDGCCDDCCDSCCSCCKPCCPCIMVAGVEAVFLNPDINGTPVAYQYFESGATPENTFFGPAFGQAALDDIYGAPRFWIGAQGCRWGIVARYFQFMANENDHDIFDNLATIPPTEHSWNVNNLLEAYAADIELTRNFCLHGCKSQVTFGVRYALIEHHEAINGTSITDPNTGGILSAYARRNRSSHGTGLTMSFNTRKPLFPCSCAHWYLNARSSILWGSNYNEVESDASVVASGGAATFASAGTIDGASVRVDDDLFIGEIQAGLQWDFALRCLPAKAFFRTAFEYQYWDAGLGSAASGSFAGFGASGSPDFEVSTSSWAPGLVVDFVGFTIGSGFTW